MQPKRFNLGEFVRHPLRGRVVTLGCLALAIGLVACAADPGARRTRRVMSEEEEIKLGQEAAEQVEQSMGFAGSAELNAYVERIGQRLVKHSSRSHLAHDFHVVDMKEPNAFALPGGHIYVSRGLLALMNSEDELATVLGHEIGHVAGRHSAQRQAKSRGWIPLQVLAGIGGAATSVVSPTLGGVVAGVGQLPAALAIASYSRKQEEEADRLGQQYAAAEGWDPAALSNTMDALTEEQKLEGGRDPNRMSFFDSHPTTPDRARDGREYASTLMVAPANRVAIDRGAFVQRLDGLVVGESARAGVFVNLRFVHPELDFTLSFPEGWEQENSPSAVLAYPNDESAVLALQVAGEGDDPAAVADEVESQVALLERSGPKTINGLPAESAVTRIVDSGQEIYISLTWIAKDGLIYQILGATTSGRWGEHRPTFEATAESFRAPSADELDEVHENRLRLATAKADETLSAIAKRTKSQWSSAKMAVANAMTTKAKLSGGEPIKVSKREPYSH
jgi:predicted Zn-dependent protease